MVPLRLDSSVIRRGQGPVDWPAGDVSCVIAVGMLAALGLRWL
jgi:hypothetical protein